MKLDAKTIGMLKNFSTINPSILIKEGNVLATISPTKTVMAKAAVPTNFPKRFAIYELSKLIGGFSLLEDPEVEFGDQAVKFSDASGKHLRLKYTPEDSIKTPPEKDISLPSIDAQFKLTDVNLKNIVKAAGVLNLTEIAFVGDGQSVLLQAVDSKTPDGHTHNSVLGTTDKNFRVIFKAENLLKLYSGDYDVSICSKGISHFKGEGTEYWIAIETNSTF